jgi:hypothetical protein
MLFGLDVAKIEAWLAGLAPVAEAREQDATIARRLPYREPRTTAACKFGNSGTMGGHGGADD